MKVSVIIPCYNDGKLLKNAVESVLAIKSSGIELIIVNDGSSDPETLELLAAYARQGLKILNHENRGVAYTRNRGIREAGGEYILPLDADNVITQAYIEKAILYLNSRQYDIVYGRPFFLGEDIPERKFAPHEFIGQDLIWGNYIDACAVYRKTVWQGVGGYDEKIPYQGYEDWEFWLNSYLSGYRFKFIDEEMFGYTIRSGSLITTLANQQKFEACHDYMVNKHAVAMVASLKDIYTTYRKQQRNYLKTSLKYLIKPITGLIGGKARHR